MKNIPIILVTGGVISGIGKGAAAASAAFLLQKQGYKISILKLENYLNVDAGTMNPVEHGDPFLTYDGKESDMDLGTYERFLDQEISGNSYITMGQIYSEIIAREREMYYAGKTVDPENAIRNLLLEKITNLVQEDNTDILVIELGGSIGEIQNKMYYQAFKYMKFSMDIQILHIHLSYAPYIENLGEIKTKPVQYTANLALSELGFLDFVFVRHSREFDSKRLDKLQYTLPVKRDHIIDIPDVESLFRIVTFLDSNSLSQKILELLGLSSKEKLNLSSLEEYIKQEESLNNSSFHPKKISIVGKYLKNGNSINVDSYFALIDALKQSSISTSKRITLNFVDSDDLNENVLAKIEGSDGIIVPIGWGGRGVDGKIAAIRYAREKNIPYLGLCYGMQLACIEYARNVLGIENANSLEIDPICRNPIIHSIDREHASLSSKSKNVFMRLGTFPAKLKENTQVFDIYNDHGDINSEGIIFERHRHKYEFNNKYRDIFEQSGFVFSGVSPDNEFVEFIELPQSVHKFS